MELLYFQVGRSPAEKQVDPPRTWNFGIKFVAFKLNLVMKIYLYLVLILTVFFSCKKKTNSLKPCKGYFLGMASLNRYLGLYRFSVDTFPKIHDEYRRFYSDELVFGIDAFNSQLKIYYSLMILENENKINLIQYHINEDDMQDHDVSYSGSLDSFIKSTDFPSTLLLCNSKTNKLYLVHYDDWIDKTTDKIFELNISGGNCTERLLYATPKDISIGSPTIDENSGVIYFVNDDILLKFENTSGSTPIAKDLKNVKPCGLHFESADPYDLRSRYRHGSR